MDSNRLIKLIQKALEENNNKPTQLQAYQIDQFLNRLVEESPTFEKPEMIVEVIGEGISIRFKPHNVNQRRFLKFLESRLEEME